MPCLKIVQDNARNSYLRHWAAKQVTLKKSQMELKQEARLIVSLDAFRRNLHFERASQRDNRVEYWSDGGASLRGRRYEESSILSLSNGNFQR